MCWNRGKLNGKNQSSGVLGLGGEFWCKFPLVPTGGPMLILRGEGGKWVLPVSLFPEGSLSECKGYLFVTHFELSNLPTVCPRCPSDRYFHAVGLQALCPAFSPREAPMSSKLFQSCWLFEIESVSGAQILAATRNVSHP